MKPLVQPARLMVDKTRLREVKEILRELKINYGPQIKNPKKL
ncbi:MAG: hypothetical protein PF545_07770 [Elusimicrobia bacterium]|jgi:signal recognition particle subunit SEC65|nr:hypothetical protein [Elusimicrobiota bacterium]